MNKLSGADVRRLLNLFFLKVGFKVCLFSRVADHRPCRFRECTNLTSSWDCSCADCSLGLLLETIIEPLPAETLAPSLARQRRYAIIDRERLLNGVTRWSASKQRDHSQLNSRFVNSQFHCFV
jgi:hypothetical protein